MYFMNKTLKSGTYSSNSYVPLVISHPNRTCIVKEILAYNSDPANDADLEISVYDPNSGSRTAFVTIKIPPNDSFQLSSLISIHPNQEIDIKTDNSSLNLFSTLIYVKGD